MSREFLRILLAALQNVALFWCNDDFPSYEHILGLESMAASGVCHIHGGAIRCRFDIGELR